MGSRFRPLRTKQDAWMRRRTSSISVKVVAMSTIGLLYFLYWEFSDYLPIPEPSSSLVYEAVSLLYFNAEFAPYLLLNKWVFCNSPANRIHKNICHSNCLKALKATLFSEHFGRSSSCSFEGRSRRRFPLKWAVCLISKLISVIRIVDKTTPEQRERKSPKKPQLPALMKLKISL